MSGFSSEVISDWAKRHVAPGSHVRSDGLACFRAVTTANCHHKAVVTGGKHPTTCRSSAESITLLGNLKTGFNGTFHAFNFEKYARHYQGGYCFGLKRRFSIVEMTERIANVVCRCMPCTERDLRVAEAYGIIESKQDRHDPDYLLQELEKLAPLGYVAR